MSVFGAKWEPILVSSLAASTESRTATGERGAIRGSGVLSGYDHRVSAGRPEVPAEIEKFLIGLYARAGEIGGAIGGLAAGVVAGPGVAAGARRAGGRGGARGAARLPTKVEERTGNAPGTAEQIAARLTAAFPRATRLPADEHVRLAVPVGVTALQQIVIDLQFRTAEDQTGTSRVLVRLRGFGKEGLISRNPTRTVTNQAWSAVMAEGN
jgi:hypothetical protein